MITAIVFDFGRVISAQKPPYLFQGCEEELGLAPDTINQIMFASRDWQEALQGRKTLAQFWQAIGTELGLKAPGEIDDFRRRYRADEEVNESVLDLIRRLYDQYKLAVLSNYPPGLTQWLADWRILDFFDVVLLSRIRLRSR